MRNLRHKREQRTIYPYMSSAQKYHVAFPASKKYQHQDDHRQELHLVIPCFVEPPGSSNHKVDVDRGAEMSGECKDQAAHPTSTTGEFSDAP